MPSIQALPIAPQRWRASCTTGVSRRSEVGLERSAFGQTRAVVCDWHYWRAVMQSTTTLAGALLLSAFSCLSSGAFAADQSNLGLPEVTVTAPPIIPSWKKWNPYSSNPRVEEDKWPEIPCSGSRISAGAATDCRTGPPLGQDGMGLPNSNMTSINPSNCRMAHDLVFAATSNLMIEADAVVVDPYFVSATG